MSTSSKVPDPTPLVSRLAQAADASKTDRSQSVGQFLKQMAELSGQAIEYDLDAVLDWADRRSPVRVAKDKGKDK